MLSQTLTELLIRLPRPILLEVMVDALDLMQQHNGRSHAFCVLTAIGAVETEEDRWRVPKLSQIKKRYS